jgi:Electron transfer DM13
MKKLNFVILPILLSLSISCTKKEKITPINMTIDSVLVDDTLKSGTFITRDAGHPTQGNVLLIKKIDGSSVLQFQNFSTGGGPDVDILAGKTITYSANSTLKIDDLKNSGNFVVNLPSGLNTDEYSVVQIWCRQFDVLFATAELK